MSYVGTKIFFGVCVNIYATVLLMDNQTIWLNKRFREEREIIISGTKRNK
jgi:hypothetical protein